MVFGAVANYFLVMFRSAMSNCGFQRDYFGRQGAFANMSWKIGGQNELVNCPNLSSTVPLWYGPTRFYQII